jgi:hypothetical protein
MKGPRNRRKRERDGYRSSPSPCKHFKRSNLLHIEDICFENPESVNYKPNLAKRKPTTNNCLKGMTDSGSIDYTIKE